MQPPSQHITSTILQSFSHLLSSAYFFNCLIDSLFKPLIKQGLNDEEVAARAAITLKAANVTGQSTDDVSEQLTAVWNGYKVTAD